MTWLVVKSHMVWGHITQEVLLMAENWLQVCQLKTHPRWKRKFNYTAAYQYILLQIATVHFFPEVEFKRINTILDKSRGQNELFWFWYYPRYWPMESQALGTIMNKKENLAEFFVMLIFIGRSWPLFGGSVFANVVICRFLLYCALWMHCGRAFL